MPRTAEHRVECHRAATKLRQAGMPIWSRTVRIKHILHEDQMNETPEHVVSVANRIAAVMRRELPGGLLDSRSDSYSEELTEVVESLEQCTLEVLALDKKNGDEAVDMLNDWLEQLYDWADGARVWIG